MHMMIDIETLGTLPGSVITQIGYCIFDPEGRGVEETHTFHVDPQSCLDAGLTVDWDMLSWWLERTGSARLALTRPETRHSLAGALLLLIRAFNQGEAITYVWAKPPQFDVALLAAAAAVIGGVLPWDHRDVRDMRTLLNLYPDGDLPEIVPQIPHLAGSDAEAQALRVQRALRRHKTAIMRTT